MPTPAQKNAGFTLVELMIVAAIIATLSAIALPSYESYLRKTRRTEARNALLDLLVREEKFFSINHRYTDEAKNLGYPSLPFDIRSSGSASFYRLSVMLNKDGTFSASAAPKSAQAKDAPCHTFTVTGTGLRGNVNARGDTLSADQCW